MIANQVPIQNSIVNGTDDVVYDPCFPSTPFNPCEMGVETACFLSSIGLLTLAGLGDYCDDLNNL